MNFWKVSEEGLLCLACGHACVLRDGQVGVCGVRKRTGDRLESLSQGHLTAIHADPLEKKPLHHFLPGQQVLSVGAWGCNMKCPWCQNWEISQTHPDHFQEDITEPWELIEVCERKKIPVLGFTYNEPTIYPEYVLETFRLAKNRGLKTILVTNGFFSQEFADLIAPYLDGANVDLKHWGAVEYRHWTTGRLEIIRRNIQTLLEKKVWVEITSLIIPRVNDQPEPWRPLAHWMADLSSGLPWHVSAFRPHYHMQDRPPTTPAQLQAVAQVGLDAGLQFVYRGNLEGDPCQTLCPGCHQVVISRVGYTVVQGQGFDGRCPHCGQEIPGVWSI